MTRNRPSAQNFEIVILKTHIVYTHTRDPDYSAILAFREMAHPSLAEHAQTSVRPDGREPCQAKEQSLVSCRQ